MWLLLEACLGPADASAQEPTPSTAGLTVHVRQGLDAVNDVRERTFVIPVVEVRDARDQPVADAEVTFELPSDGPGGSFHGWMRAQTLRSDAQGQASASGFSPNNETGRFEIRVTAVSGARTGAASIVQTNGPVTTSMASGQSRASFRKLRLVVLIASASAAIAIPVSNLSRNSGSKAGWWGAALAVGSAMTITAAILRRPKSQPDEFTTAGGPIKITSLRHATLLIRSPDGVIYVDPTGEAVGPGKPRADLVLITDAYRDHFDAALLHGLVKSGGVVYGPEAAARAASGILPMRNGEQRSWRRWQIEATPAYNVPRSAALAKVFHEKGLGNGYVLSFGGKRFYVSGNTGDTPEVRNLREIDVAFLCMSPPYTMSAKEAADAARAFQPKVVFPYHYVGSLVSVYQFKKALEGTSTEVRIRNWYP